MTVLQKLGIIAGKGALPPLLAARVAAQGIAPFVVRLDPDCDPELTRYPGFDCPFAKAGRIVKALQKEGISDIVLLGSLRRPAMRDLRPDLYTAKFLAKLGLGALGDDGLLKAVRAQLEKDGFRIRGAHEFLSDCLTPSGILTRAQPGKGDLAAIETGFAAAKMLGALDVGQSIVVFDRRIIGLEAAEGTDALLRRCAGYRGRQSRGGILVKACKPAQDRDLDMPAIGPQTVALCAELGYDGIAAEAGATLMAGREETVALADRHRLFVYGYDG